MKKRKHTRTILTAILLFVVAVTQAQSNIDSIVLEKVFDRTPYIFEGTVLEKCYFKEPSNGLIYTANIVEISKFIKGTLQCGTVTVVTEGGETANEKQTLSHNTEFTKGYIGIFACIPSHLPTNSTNCPPTDNPDALSLVFSEHAQIDYFADGINKIAEGFNSKFETLQDLYDFIDQKLGYTIVDCNTANFQIFENELNLIQRKIIVNNQEDDTGINDASRASGEFIKYTFANQKITGNATKYCEFDVRVEANDNTTFLGKGAFRIGFNKSAFGVQIAGNVSVLLNPAFDAATYNNIQVVNRNDSVFSVIIDGPANPSNRKNITTSRIPIVHIKIPFTDCAQFPNLNFADFPQATATANNIYALSANALSSQTFLYDSVSVFGQTRGLICEPEITKVYETNNAPNTFINGGTASSVTIEGNHFLAQRGNLFLRNADNGGRTFLPLDHYDIQSWTDTFIQFTMPSRIDSGIFVSGSYKVGIVGSGVPMVKNIRNLISDSFLLNTNRIVVPFSASQSSKKTGGVFFKENRVLLSEFPDSGFTFILNSNIPQPMRECVRAAINRWRCATGVNFKLDETNTTTDTVKLDGKNVVTLGSFAPQDSQIVATTSSFFTNTCNALNEPFPTQEIDIKINTAKLNSFYYDTTGTQDIPFPLLDFFEAILHELGHAHSLSHVNEENQLMYHSLKRLPGAVTIPANLRRSITYPDQQGGDYIMERSTSTDYGFSCSFNIPMAMQDTSCRVSPTGIKNVETTFEARVYPNPFTHQLNIESNEPLTSLQLFNIQGQLIKSILLENVREHSLSTNDVSNGVYFLKLNSKYKQTQKKIVCAQ